MNINATSMTAMSNWMNNSAQNVANVNTENYNATQTTISNQGNAVVAQSSQTENGTDLATEFTDQIALETNFEANTKPIQAEDEMIGSLLDMKA
ncbi:MULTISPECIES: flagellar basal body rod C-terminal domain-containing protein [unclassified Sulfurospirillum]|uniref:flagellar basal body rod C-terminal domain-containing protein n=1 Tax=unclassified Sulfurospirillum TaxID=2618290 RepID=UPI00050426AC|nr:MULTISPECIES: flagellar basal body rod C-terminal domain-containing protein [unclassified Sulfurospirillum]KFL35122.1 flagellar hook protein FlgE [Sulfurospirillum sp. SCADC]